MRPRQTLRQFIVECLMVSEKADVYGVKKCTAMSLVHQQGANQVELKTIRFGAHAHDPKDLAEMFEQTAENFAGGVPGVQQFQVLAFFDESDRPQSFYPFRKSTDPDHAGLSTEAPTSSGIAAQLMRHNEALSRISAGNTAHLFGIMSGIIEKQNSRIAMLEEEQHDTIELAKNLVMQSAADEHGRAVALIELRQKAKDRETLMRLLPPVANRVLGKEIFPQATADTALFEHLAESLDEKQIKQLATILKPEQWGLIADRLVQVLERKAKQDAEDAAAGGKKPEAAE